MSEEFRPAPERRPRRDPSYKPKWQPRPLHAAGLALGRTLQEYALLMRLHRPIGIWLLLWPTLWALWIAGDGRPAANIFLIFMAGVLVMRSAGCVINDYADRDLDPRVERTRQRPLAAGRVSPGEALILFIALGLLAVWLALQLEPLAQMFAAAGGLLTVTYPFLKRWVHLPQFYLGVAFGWSSPMAFVALTGSVPRVGWLILATVVLWAAVYDTMYAMVDREDDLAAGVKSTAILFGDADRLIIAVMQAMVIMSLWLVGDEAGLGAWYRSGVMAGGAVFLYQQQLIRQRDPARCFQAFNNNHYFGLVVFIGLALDYLLPLARHFRPAPPPTTRSIPPLRRAGSGPVKRQWLPLSAHHRLWPLARAGPPRLPGRRVAGSCALRAAPDPPVPGLRAGALPGRGRAPRPVAGRRNGQFPAPGYSRV